MNERSRMEDLDIGEMIILQVPAVPQHGRSAHAHCRKATWNYVLLQVLQVLLCHFCRYF